MLSKARIRGSTGPSPTTSWFGSVPDRLNMLRSYEMNAVTNGVYRDFNACNYFNQWVIFNPVLSGGTNTPVGTLGDFTTAPDGTTNTAQRFVESTDNVPHFMNAGMNATIDLGRLTFAGFFKYAGRRVVLELLLPAQGTGGPPLHFPGGLGGVKAIFDLQGGQFVDVGLFGTGIGRWTPYPARMTPYGDGWYLCAVEAFVNNDPFIPGGFNFFCRASLDNGTGLAPESTTYAGDGVSGVYGWRMNLMPTRAYAMNDVTLFEDFNDLSSIDVNNTQGPGYKFYMGCPFPLLPGDRAPPSNIFSTADSILTMQPWGPGQVNVLSMQTAYCVGAFFPPPDPFIAPQPWGGTGYVLPLLHEIRVKWPYSTDASFANSTGAAWAWSIDFIVDQPKFGDPTNGTGPQTIGQSAREIDFLETFGGGGGGNSVIPNCTAIFYGLIANGYDAVNVGKIQSLPGYPTWYNIKQYPIDQIVFFNGAYYKCINVAFGDAQNPTNPAFWTPFTGIPAPINIDMDAFHTYHCLMLPYEVGEAGLIVHFIDGVYMGCPMCYQPAPIFQVPDTRMQTNDSLPLSLIYGPGSTTSPTAQTFSIDWIKVTQY